jgi:hypothetical protein
LRVRAGIGHRSGARTLSPDSGVRPRFQR